MCVKFLLLPAIVELLTFISTEYIHTELAGNKLESSWNFSIFIKNSTGIILYATESYSKLLIDLEMKFDKKTINLQYNKFKITETVSKICGCSICSDFYLTVALDLHLCQVMLLCNRQKTTNKIICDQDSVSDELIGYPIPKDYNVSKIKTFIWIGNIGPYTGLQKMKYHPLKSQLKGCLDKFYFNNQMVKIDHKGVHLCSFCRNQYKETKCNKKSCTIRQMSFETFDCWGTMLNLRYCEKDLMSYSTIQKSHKIETLVNSSTILILEWKSQINHTYCLMDILTNKQRIFFVVNDQNLVVMNYINPNLNINTKTMSKISRISNTILIVNFTDQELIVKISNGEEIYIFTDPIVDRPRTVNIGYFQLINVCTKFEGLIDFQSILIPLKHSKFLNFNFSRSRYTKVLNPKKAYVATIAVAITLFAGSLFVLCYVIWILSTRKHYAKNGNPVNSLFENERVHFKQIHFISMPYRESGEYAVVTSD